MFLFQYTNCHLTCESLNSQAAARSAISQHLELPRDNGHSRLRIVECGMSSTLGEAPLSPSESEDEDYVPPQPTRSARNVAGQSKAPTAGSDMDSVAADEFFVEDTVPDHPDSDVERFTHHRRRGAARGGVLPPLREDDEDENSGAQAPSSSGIHATDNQAPANSSSAQENVTTNGSSIPDAAKGASSTLVAPGTTNVKGSTSASADNVTVTAKGQASTKVVDTDPSTNRDDASASDIGDGCIKQNEGLTEKEADNANTKCTSGTVDKAKNEKKSVEMAKSGGDTVAVAKSAAAKAARSLGSSTKVG